MSGAKCDHCKGTGILSGYGCAFCGGFASVNGSGIAGDPRNYWAESLAETPPNPPTP